MIELFECPSHKAMITANTCRARMELITRGTRSAKIFTGYWEMNGCGNCAIGRKKIKEMEENMIETQICKKCGIPKPLDDFQTHARSKTGRGGICKLCMSSLIRKNHKPGRPAKEAKPSETAPVDVKKNVVAMQRRDHRDPEVVDETVVVMVDFSEYPDVLAGVKKMAKDAMRTPENFIVWALNQAMAR